MKEIGYHIFAFFYQILKLLPIKKNSAFLVMTHDGGREGNVGVTASYMRHFYHTKLYGLRRQDTEFHGKGGIKRILRFFFLKPLQMARAEYIFMDNAFLPMAYLKIRPQTTVVQLWHGTGTIKKFGQDVNQGKLFELEKKANQNLDYVIVSSDATKELYAGCFGVAEDQVKVLGLPRTDLLFSQKELQKRRKQFLEQYPELENKKLILYAPTFRDQETEHPRMMLDLDQMAKNLPKEYCLGLRLHPFVARQFQMDERYQGKIYDFSTYDNLNTLLMSTDILISDYSSIIFEYCVFGRPMIFYAYDLEEFSDHGRGFYKDYESYVPGPVVRTTQELLDVVKDQKWDMNYLKKFFEQAYQYQDGRSTKRVVDLVRHQQ